MFSLSINITKNRVYFTSENLEVNSNLLESARALNIIKITQFSLEEDRVFIYLSIKIENPMSRNF